jgi:carbamoyltransferase
MVARAISEGCTVGVLAGRMEFGPRALGGRSILGDPRREDTQKNMNLKIKYRESFRPFAPSVLAERVSDYFEMEGESPYMLLVAPVCNSRCLPMEDDDGEDLLLKVNRKRSDIPSVTHVDYSARVQTVHRETNPLYHEILTAFERLTGCAVIVNTSFNVRGEPIVCTPQDAYLCFMRTEMDFLYLDGVWLDKAEQPPLAEDEDWRRQYVLD